MFPLRRVLISVTDKTKIELLAESLVEHGAEILSTGGTAATLKEHSIPVKEISEATGFPEILGGRVKTLHPRVHGGILYRRDLDSDESDIQKHGIDPIDMVIVNLYDFAGKLAEENPAADQIIEAIDIGGPTMIRAAAKNWKHVAVVTSPGQYEEIISALADDQGLNDNIRRKLAAEAFAHTAKYDSLISRWFADFAKENNNQGEILPESISYHLNLHQKMRYGENPHQSAAFYRLAGEEGIGISACKQLHGKALSFNNLIDADIALTLPFEFEEPCAAILKHTTPCGVGIGSNLAQAESRARACDPLSAYGGIVGLNRTCDADTATQISKAFTEVIVAPGYTEEALKILKKKKNLRLLEIPPGAVKNLGLDIRRVSGGMLMQERDYGFPELEDLQVVSRRAPSAEEMAALRFGWVVVKYVKSNAVLFARDGQTLGMGAGQMSRVDAVRVARMKAADENLNLNGSILASDAYFPFPDGLEQAAEAGATAVIQPGGSIRDKEVIARADELGMAMVLTGKRHFRHA